MKLGFLGEICKDSSGYRFIPTESERVLHKGYGHDSYDNRLVLE